MAEFVYKNVKNASTGYILFELNYDYKPYISFRNKNYLCSKSCFANKLAKKLKELMLIY